MKNYCNVETEASNKLSCPQMIRIVKFSEIIEGEVGEYIDRILEEEKWELQYLQNGESEGYQLFLGEGVYVDNRFEYGFPYLYELDDVISFAEHFYEYRQSLSEEELERIGEESEQLDDWFEE